MDELHPSTPFSEPALDDSATASFTETPKPPPLFRSFWMGGFESACHISNTGERLDMIAGVQHDTQAEHDYALLRSAGMQAARDGARWHLIDRGGRYDWSSFESMFDAAQRQGIQVIWDICHYGWPDDIDLLSAAFVDRFARFSAALARFIADRSDEIPFYTPVNEISFFSWAAGRDFMYPFAHGCDVEIKRQLVRAVIAGCDAILAVDRRARFVYPEPVIHVLPPRDRPDLVQVAESYRNSQFEAWDMVAGRASRELGGEARFLDIIGANFYHSNEWEIEGNGRLRWEDEPRDDRWLPFHRLLGEIWDRYHRPLFVAETSHFGTGRARWIREIAQEVYQVRMNDVPVAGICLYPILERYDWQNRNHWHNSGLWDFVQNGSGAYRRILNEIYANELYKAQSYLASIGCV